MDKQLSRSCMIPQLKILRAPAPESNVREFILVKLRTAASGSIGGDDGTHLTARTSVIRFDSASTTFCHALDLAIASVRCSEPP